MSNLFISWHLG